MLLGFAAAWPFNIARAWKARTTLGVSLQFYVIIECAYVCGMLSKFARDDVNYVLGFYILDFSLVLVAILIYFRNRAIDRERGVGRMATSDGGRPAPAPTGVSIPCRCMTTVP